MTMKIESWEPVKGSVPRCTAGGVKICVGVVVVVVSSPPVVSTVVVGGVKISTGGVNT